MKHNVTVLTLASYLSMLFLGVASTLIGAAARNIDLTPFQIGLFLAVQNIGFVLAVWVSGTLADNHEKPRILLAGSLILAFSFFAFYATGVFWLNVLIMMLIGAGIGTYEGVTDAMLLDMHRERQSLHINVNHFFVTFGSILITLYLIFLQMNWRSSLIQSAAVVLVLALIFALTRLPAQKGPGEAYGERIRILSRDRLVVVLFLATALVVGVELGTVGIMTTYLVELRGFDQTTSKIGLLIFLLGIATGRLIVGFLNPSQKLFQFILVLFGLATLFFGAMYFLNLAHWTTVPVFLAGLSMSALVPLIITLAGQSYPQMAGTVTGSIKVAIPLGGILLPFIMSLAASQSTLQAALLVFPLALLLAFGLLWLEFRRRTGGKIRVNY